MEWQPKIRTRCVGLLMNVLGYRFRDDIPTKPTAFERTVHDHENQSSRTADDDIKIGGTMLRMEDMRVKEHLIRNSVRITSLIRCERICSRPREHNSTSTVNQCQCSSERIRRPKARARTAKAKAKERISRAKTRPKRLKYLAEAEGKPVAASPHPHDTAAVVPLQCLLPGERHSSTFVIAMLCVNNETSFEFSSEQAVRSPGAGSFAPQKHNE